MDSGRRTDIDHVVGSQDCVLIVFDDDHSVADVPKMLERVQQTRIVPLMQADRRLIEHIKHACETGSDLRGEPNSLTFPAGQSS